MAKDSKESTHSLVTEIRMNMSLNEEGRTPISVRMEEISSAASKMNEPFKVIQKALDDLNDNPLEGIIGTLEGLKLDGGNITSHQLKLALEDKIREAITKSKIRFVGEDGNDKSIVVSMGDDFWENNRAQIQKSIGDSLSNIMIDKGDIPPLDVTEIMRNFNETFNTQIADLIKDQGMFDLYTEKKGEKVPRYKTPFKMDKKAIQNIMGTIQDSFSEYLGDSKNIDLADMPKLTISSEELSKIVDKISDSIGNLDEHMGIDPKMLEELPSISNKMEVFKEKLVSMVEDINSLSTELESLSFGEITDKDLEKTIASIKRLKKSVIVNLDKWADGLVTDLSKTMSKDTDLTKIKTSLDNVNSYIDELVISKITQLNNDIESITSKGNASDTEKIRGIPDMIISKITDDIVDHILEDGLANITLDSQDLSVKISEWGRDFEKGTAKGVESLFKGITADMYKVLIRTSEGVSGIVNNHMTKLGEVIDGVDKLQNHPLGDIVSEEDLMESIRNHFKIGSIEELGIDDKLALTFKATIGKSIGDLVNVAGLGVGVMFTEMGVEINQQINKLVGDQTELLRSHITTLTNLLDQSNRDNIGNIFNDDYLNEISKGIETQINDMVVTYIDRMTDAPEMGEGNRAIRKVNKDFSNMVFQIIGEKVEDYTRSIQKYFTDSLGGGNEADLSKHVELLNSFEEPMMRLVDSSVDTALSQTKAILYDLARKTRKNALAGTEYTEMIDKVGLELDKAVGKVSEQFLNTVSELFGSFKTTKRMIGTMQKELDSELEGLMKQALDLDGGQSASKKITNITTKIGEGINGWLNELKDTQKQIVKVGTGATKTSMSYEKIVKSQLDLIDTIDQAANLMESYSGLLSTEQLNNIGDIVDKYTKKYIEEAKSQIDNFKITSSQIKGLNSVFNQVIHKVTNQVKQQLSKIKIDETPDMELNVDAAMKKINSQIVSHLNRMNYVLEGELDTKLEAPQLKAMEKVFKQVTDKALNQLRQQLDTLELETSVDMRLNIDTVLNRINRQIVNHLNSTTYDIEGENTATIDASQLRGLEKIFKQMMNKSISQVQQQLNTLELEITTDMKINVDTAINRINGQIVRHLNQVTYEIEGKETATIGANQLKAIDRLFKQIVDKAIEGAKSQLSNVDFDITPNMLVDANSVIDKIKREIIKHLNKMEFTIEGESSSKINTSQLRSMDKIFNQMIYKIVEQVRVQLHELQFDTVPDLTINIDNVITKITRDIEKRLNTMDYILEGRTETEIDSDLLDKSIDRYIRKFINAKSREIGKIKPDLSSRDVVTEDLNLLHNAIGEYIKKSIKNYDVALKESVNKKFSAKGMGYIFDKVIKVFNRAFYQYGEQMAKSFEAMNLSDVSMNTRGLDTETRKRLADKLGVSVSELLREMPELDGVDYGREVMTTNVRVITDAVNKYIGESIKTLMQFYKESIKDAEIEPDVELTGYVLTEIRKFQDAIIKKTREMVRDQFRFLTEEINAMNIDAKSLGYKPTQAFDRAAARANPNLMTSEGITVAELKEVIKSANKESTVKVDKMSLSGTTIDAEGLTKVDTDQLKANIKNNLITEAPNVIVNGRTIDLKTQDFNLDKFALPLENYLEKMPFTDEMAHILPQLNKLTTQDFMKGSQYSNPYNPLNANNIAFPQQQAPSKGGMTKVFENMARYFFVGYAMQMPIKAITSATKVSSELDYRVAKSKQNILIKDPTMENTARSVVYERYQSEGKDVGTVDFQADVQRESAKLRNMMSNEMNGYLINVAKAYYQDIGEVGKYYEIASRRSSDPYDALNKTKEIAKIAAAEMDMDTEFAAIGLEALAVQWGIQAEELDKYTNMMLKTAMLSSTTVTDLLSTQRDTGQMFKSRLTGMDDERSYATAMALSSMFTESTGKSGREGGTFWKNILNRPYVKDSRKYLEAAAQHPEFEGLDPYYTDKDGNRRQKDFLTMLTGIMEASLKVDDPSKMAMYSELFPIRTISGAESLTAITDSMKKNFEETVKIMRETGELGPDATIDNVNVKDVIEAYVDKIIDTDDEDIAGYIAGLQDTYKFGVQGLTTQWESTVYKIFMEFKEESSLAMTYLTHILRQFEDSSSSLSEVIKIFAKIGTGLLGEKLIKSGYAKLTAAPTKPSEFQKKMAADHNLLRVAEHAKQVEVSAIESITRPMVNKIETLQADREVVKGKMAGWQGYVDNFGEADTTEKQVLFNKAQVELEMLTTEYSNLGKAIKTTEEMMSPYIDTLNDATKAHGRIMSLGDFLDDGMGSRRPQDLKANLGNMYRNDYAYNEIAKFSLRNQPDFSDEWYAGVQARKDELEEMMRQQQKSAIEFYTTKYPKIAEKDLTNLLGEDFGDPMYGFGHRLTEQSTSIMDGIARSIAVDTTDTGEFKKIFHDMKLDFENTRAELEGVNKEIIKMNVDKAKVETIIFEAERPIEGLAGMVNKTPRDIMGMYRDLMPAAGVDVAQFESGMDKLTSMFTEGKLDVDMYEDSLREVSTQLGISDKDFLQFKEVIRQINAEVQLGKTSIMEYITALQTANTLGHLPSVNKVTDVVDNLQKSTKPGTGVDPDILGTAVGGSALLAATQGLDKSNNLSKIGEALTKLSSTVKGGKIATAAGDLVSKGSTALKALPGIGMKMASLYAITDIAGKGFGGMTESTMSEGDRKSNQSDRLDETINKFVGRGLTKNDSDFAYLFKGFVSGGANLWDAIGNQFSNAVGGTAPTWSESMAIERMVAENPNMDRAELVALIKSEFDVEALRREGSILKQLEHLSNNPMNDKDGKPMDFTDPKGDQLPLEELMDFIGRELGLLNEKLGASDNQYTNEKLRLLISGSTENSTEMRKAIKEHLDRNIAELETMIESFKVYLEQLAPGTENYRAMQMHIMDMENKKLESELGLIENTFSELNEITTEAGKRGTDIQARYDIKRYDALLSGIKEDSHAIRQIENKMAEAQIQSIDTTKTSLTKLLDEFKNDPHRRDQILAQMLQLDVEKRRLLYDIKEKLPGTMSTFNLPSEIKPITYYEAMARKGTAKNMSVRAGDTIVNVNIDNMSGSDADIDRMGRAVSNAVNNVQKNYVRQFANDVKSGMGNNYYSWNQY